MIPIPTLAAADSGTAADPTPLQISYVGSSGVNGFGGNISVSQPAGIQAGDIGIFAFRFTGSSTPTIPPTGFTQGLHNRVFWKVYGANEPAVSVPMTSSVQRAAVLSVFRNVHPSSPISAETSATPNSGTSFSGTAATAAHDRTLLVTVAGISVSSGTPTLTAPSDATLTIQRSASVPAVGIAYKAGPANGQPSTLNPWQSSIAISSSRIDIFLLRPADT